MRVPVSLDETIKKQKKKKIKKKERKKTKNGIKFSRRFAKNCSINTDNEIFYQSGAESSIFEMIYATSG